MRGDIQYIADSFLLERMFEKLASEDAGLEKYAFDLKSVLGGIEGSIKSFVGSQIANKDKGGVTKTVVNFLAPAMFFRLHPILGILVTAGQLFGIDIYSIFKRIVSAIKPDLEAGKPVSADKVNQAAKGVMGSQASDDFLEPLRKIEASGELEKISQYGRYRGGNTWQRQEFLPKDRNPLIRMFSFMRPRQRGSIMVGIIVWFIKTILLSAGLLAGAGAVSSMMGKKPTEDTSKDTSGTGGGTGRKAPEKQVTTPTQSIVDKRNTGAGSKVYKNNPGDMWVENLGGQQPHERLLQWAVNSYPGLYEYQDIILRTPEFWDAVTKMTKGWPSGQQQLVIPDPFKKRDDILKLFVPKVFNQINRGM